MQKYEVRNKPGYNISISRGGPGPWEKKIVFDWDTLDLGERTGQLLSLPEKTRYTAIAEIYLNLEGHSCFPQGTDFFDDGLALICLMPHCQPVDISLDRWPYPEVIRLVQGLKTHLKVNRLNSDLSVANNYMIDRVGNLRYIDTELFSTKGFSPYFGQFLAR
jgi:hypothetical protein